MFSSCSPLEYIDLLVRLPTGILPALLNLPGWRLSYSYDDLATYLSLKELESVSRITNGVLVITLWSEKVYSLSVDCPKVAVPAFVPSTPILAEAWMKPAPRHGEVRRVLAVEFAGPVRKRRIHVPTVAVLMVTLMRQLGKWWEVAECRGQSEEAYASVHGLAVMFLELQEQQQEEMAIERERSTALERNWARVS